MRKSLFTLFLVLLITFSIPLNIKASSYNYVKPELKEHYITIRINPIDKVKIEKFEHIKNYELPLYYQYIIKKKLP